MKLLKVFVFILCVVCVSTPLVFAICNGNNSLDGGMSQTNASNDPYASEDFAKCIEERDQLLENKDYRKAFSYLRTLCEKYKDSESCNLTYSTYFAMQEDSVNVSPSDQNITLYEVLYYLDLGCKLNNYDSCMKAARLYEYGSKPGASSQVKGYNVAYDAQEAKKYYKRVCESVSDNAMDACSRVVELSRQNSNVPLADSFVNNLVKKLN